MCVRLRISVSINCGWGGTERGRGSFVILKSDLLFLLAGMCKKE